MGVRRPAIAITLALLGGGCTIVTIEGDARTTTPHFGVLRIEAAPAARAIVYRSKGLGIVPGRAGVTIGGARETAAFIFAEKDCRLILFQPREEDVAALRAALAATSAATNDPCILGEEN